MGWSLRFAPYGFQSRLHYRRRSVDSRKVELSVVDERFWTIKGSGVRSVFGHVLTASSIAMFSLTIPVNSTTFSLIFSDWYQYMGHKRL